MLWFGSVVRHQQHAVPSSRWHKACLDLANHLQITGINLAGVITAVSDSLRSELHQRTQVFDILPPTDHLDLLLLVLSLGRLFFKGDDVLPKPQRTILFHTIGLCAVGCAYSSLDCTRTRQDGRILINGGDMMPLQTAKQ